MAAFRRRRMGRVGRRRRARRGGRIGMRRTAVNHCVFDVEAIEYAINVPGSTNWGVWTLTSGGQLPAYQIISGNPQSIFYSLRFNPATLFSSCPGFSSLTGIYDYVLFKKVIMNLRTTFRPLTQLTTALSGVQSTLYSALGALGEDPDVTYIDYDGVTLAQGSPVNGDMTGSSLNRLGAKKHKAFGNITRVFRPKIQFPAAVTQPLGSGSNLPVFSSFVGIQDKHPGWISTTANNNMFTGQIGMAFSYKGEDPSNFGHQPQYYYTVMCQWHVAFKSLLLG